MTPFGVILIGVGGIWLVSSHVLPNLISLLSSGVINTPSPPQQQPTAGPIPSPPVQTTSSYSVPVPTYPVTALDWGQGAD